MVHNDNPRQHPAFLIHDAAKRLRHEFGRRAARIDLTPAQSRCLVFLSFSPGANLKTLATALEVQSMSVLRVIDSLEERRLLRRDSDPGDRRALKLFLTRGGESAVERIWDCPIFIDDSPDITVLQMRGKARRLKAQHGLGLIVVDYLQLMHTGGNAENRVQEIAQIARGLKSLARELKVPVIALSQLSRMVESRVPRRPQLSDLRESGAIEQDADLVMFLYRPGYYGNDEIVRALFDSPAQRKDLERMEPEQLAATLIPYRHLTEVLVAKQRNGPTGVVKLVWLPEHGMFGDVEQHAG